ncbi:hypothetical protein DFH09DRAFT_1108323 [Mycena vulgaris]|nr:hypothetical protein DFH09DRAFT_1108323 [Mycena vulgaris]
MVDLPTPNVKHRLWNFERLPETTGGIAASGNKDIAPDHAVLLIEGDLEAVSEEKFCAKVPPHFAGPRDALEIMTVGMRVRALATAFSNIPASGAWPSQFQARWSFLVDAIPACFVFSGKNESRGFGSIGSDYRIGSIGYSQVHTLSTFVDSALVLAASVLFGLTLMKFHLLRDEGKGALTDGHILLMQTRTVQIDAADFFSSRLRI